MKQNGMGKWLRAGYTLAEILTVLIIIIVLAAAAAPGLLSLAESGRQINRMDIARTLYLAAQNRLTEMRLTGQLDNFVTTLNLTDNERVYNRLGADFPATDAENAPYVYFISLPAGAPRTHPVVLLLEPVLTYREVLEHNVLIEFNIRTGLVLSVFYSDHIDGFAYNAYDNNADVTGVRGMGTNGYDTTHAFNRRQGFYGVGYTGYVPPETRFTVSLFDSFDDRGDPAVGALWDAYGGGNRHNILFASITIPAETMVGAANAAFNVSINGLYRNHFTLDGLAGTHFSMSYYGFFRVDGVDGTVVYWILDYVSDTNALSVQRLGLNPHVPIRVSVDALGRTVSSGLRHPYFSSHGSVLGVFAVRSVRHLYNIRHADGAGAAGFVYNMMNDIRLSNGSYSGIYNFPPLPVLRGTFNGNGFAVIGVTSMEGAYR